MGGIVGFRAVIDLHLPLCICNIARILIERE